MDHATDFDVVVVGSGLASHCAALAALERGSRVLMAEAAPELGGTSKLSTGMIMAAGTRIQAAHGVTDDPQELYEHYMNINQWRVQPSVAKRLCFDAAPTVHWLEDNGVEFIDLYYSGTESAPRGHVTHGGAAILEALMGRISNYDRFQSVVNTRVDRLILNDDGAIAGISCGDTDISAPSVVLACGGMGGSYEALSHWHPDCFTGAQGPIMFAGTPYSRGDNISLARQAGAQITRGKGLRFPMSIFHTAYMPNFALVVNQLGHRILDETLAYGVVEAILSDQPGGIAYLLFDDAVKRTLHSASDIASHVKIDLAGSEDGMALWRSDEIDKLVQQNLISTGNTIEELAMRLGIPPANLAGTVARYNRLVANGSDDDYFKDVSDATPLDTAPFYGTRITKPVFVVTGVGARIDEDARVIHENSEPVPGLFGAGEAVGNVIGSVYFGSGNSLSNCTVFGRLAGYGAAEYARSRNEAVA